jgi:hypothetical protein
MTRLLRTMAAGSLASSSILVGQTPRTSGVAPRSQPVIDVHVHAGSIASLPKTLAELDSNGVVIALVNGPAAIATAWAASQPKRIMSGALFPCPGGRVPNNGPQCFPDNAELPSPDFLRAELKAGRLHFLGEITTQYAGWSLTDPRMEPFYALAEELDVPIGIHLALAPVSTPYKCCPGYRSTLGNPLQLEEILVKHPKLRVWVMHAGYPYSAEMKAIMLVYPQVYVDIAAIDLSFIVPRPSFHDYLRELVHAGLGKRIMFGSDYSPIRSAIQSIETASFLSAEERRDILFNNAVKFFRLDTLRRIP